MFYVYPEDGGRPRAAEKISFMTEEETAYTLTAEHDAFTIRGRGELVHVVRSVDEAARHVARVLLLCQGHSIVIDASGTCIRGDENRTADVYPPHQQPRIKVESAR